jgi:ABC-type cobalamin/Fe3+-siderophores transport system ATPase subunit
MNIFSKDDFDNEKVSYLQFDDSFAIEDQNQIVFGSNGIGKSSIFHCIKSLKQNEAAFLSYTENNVKFSGIGKKLTITTDVQKIASIEDKLDTLAKTSDLKEIMKTSYQNKTVKSLAEYNSEKLVDAYKKNNEYEVLNVNKKKMDIVSEYIQSEECNQLFKDREKFKELYHQPYVVKDYSELYLLQVFDELSGHYDSNTRKCPVCETEGVELENIISEKRKKLQKLCESVFYPYKSIRGLKQEKQKKAISELLPILANFTEDEFISVLLSRGNFDKLQEIISSKKAYQENEATLKKLKAEKTAFYKKMSMGQEDTKKMFEREYPGAFICFDDKKEIINIDLPRDHATYSTGELDEMYLIIAVLSFMGSTKNMLVIDDPLSSYDYSNQYRIIFRLAKLADTNNKHLIIFTHNIETINIMNTQRRKRFSYFYIEKYNGVLSIKRIEDGKNSLLSLETLSKADKYVSLLSYRESSFLDSTFKGNKVFHYDEPYTFESTNIHELEFNGLTNEYLVGLIDTPNITNDSSFEKCTANKVVYMAAMRVWIEKKLYAFIRSIKGAKGNELLNKFINKDTMMEKLTLCEGALGFDNYFPKYSHTSIMMKKTMLNQNAHYKSQIIPFNFAINISLDELKQEIEEIKEMFATVNPTTKTD